MSNFVDRIIDRTNATRAEAVLDPLKENDQLNAAVQNHGKDIALANCMNDEGSDGSSQLRVIDQVDYEYTQAAKNIAVGQYTLEEVVDGWMNSLAHHANILEPNLQEIGVSFYELENNIGNVNFNSHWTQGFGTPLDGELEISSETAQHPKSTRYSDKDSNNKIDALIGSGESEMLSSGAGNTAEEKDKLVSSTEANELTGGCGADRFVVKRQIHGTETGTTDCLSIDYLLNTSPG